MENTIQPQDFLKSLSALLDETFENTQGIYLDKDTSLFHTLNGISSKQASIPVGGNCASLAAQVAHVNFYLEVLLRYVVDHDTDQVDWGEIWRRVEKVSDQEWEQYKAGLMITYRKVRDLIQSQEQWNEDSISGAMAIVVHSAYHLGEIRQALCMLRSAA